MVIAALEEVRSLQLILALYMGLWGGSFVVNFSIKQYNDTVIKHQAYQTKSNSDRKMFFDKIESTKYGNFGGIIWWQWLRLVHGLFLLLYSITTFANWYYAFTFAIADVSTGLISGIYYYRLRPCLLSSTTNSS